jgi:hypothetical protein
MRNNFYISFGVWLIILPFLGIPGSWRNMLVILSGIFLILVSLGPTILKKLQAKPKQKRKSKSDLNNGALNKDELKFSDSEIIQPTAPNEQTS